MVFVSEREIEENPGHQHVFLPFLNMFSTASFLPLTKQSWGFTTLEKKPFENFVGKIEKAGNYSIF